MAYNTTVNATTTLETLIVSQTGRASVDYFPVNAFVAGCVAAGILIVAVVVVLVVWMLTCKVRRDCGG